MGGSDAAATGGAGGGMPETKAAGGRPFSLDEVRQEVARRRGER
jgi:hypothetical protein